MPAITDEKVLSFDGFLLTSPATGVREQAQALLASHRWSTSQVRYGDQYAPMGPYGDDSPPEPTEEVETVPRWNLCFKLGLDHVNRNNSTWFADVSVIVEFLQRVRSTVGADAEFSIEVRSTSKAWYSEIVGFIANEPPNLGDIRAMIEAQIFGGWPA